MHLHILGICGTFMGGLAQIAQSLGHKVTGSDTNVYPPMSEQLAQAGIQVFAGYAAEQLNPKPDLVVVGNAMMRGNPAVESMLNQGLHYVSGPQWLAENVLQDRWVLAVAGTHGKTTTSSLLAWILDYAGLEPGFLIGGVPANFGVSARVTDSQFFVIEADEYDSAFFDKRSKFIHYRPRTLILNNLEYDHADIFPDLEAIKRQFHHLLRTVPSQALVVANGDDNNLADVISRGCWAALEKYSLTVPASKPGIWTAAPDLEDNRRFQLFNPAGTGSKVKWEMFGQHNVANALAAIAAARHAGVPIEIAVAALAEFKGIARRMEVVLQKNGITLYDDFAHHPTAIKTTLEGLRARVGQARILVAFDPRSNTMRMGCHSKTLPDAFAAADKVYLHAVDNLSWNMEDLAAALSAEAFVCQTVDSIANSLLRELQNGDHLILMSNGSFNNLDDKLISRIN